MESILANECCSNDWALILQTQNKKECRISKSINTFAGLYFLLKPLLVAFTPFLMKKNCDRSALYIPLKNPCLIHITVHILHTQIKAKGNKLKLGAAKVSKTSILDSILYEKVIYI